TFRMLIRSVYAKCSISNAEHGLMVSEVVESLAKNGQLRMAFALFRAHDVTLRSANFSRNAFRQATMFLFTPILYLASLFLVHTHLVSWVFPRLRARIRRSRS